MFEELDDPTPPVRGPEALPQVRARGQALRRRRQLALGTGAGATTALVAVLLLTLPGGGPPDERLVPAAPSSSSPAPVPSTTPPSGTAAPTPDRTPTVPAPSSTPQPSRTGPAPSSPTPSAPPSAGPGGALELRGDDLGVTAVGRPRAEAVAAVRAVLGAPVADPATTVGCIEAQEEVAWQHFRLGFDADDRVSGWSSTSPDLATPSGVSVGTTVARLQEVYGDRLRLYPSDTEAGNTYTVEGVDMLGQLDGTEPGDRVVALRNGSCTGP